MGLYFLELQAADVRCEGRAAYYSAEKGWKAVAKIDVLVGPSTRSERRRGDVSGCVVVVEDGPGESEYLL